MFRALAVLLTFGFFHLPVLQAAPISAKLISQDPSQDQPQDQSQDQSQNQSQDQSQDQSQNSQQDQGYENFSPEQLDNLVSPIALYPDPLLAQLFVAATFPDQVEEAARYVRANGQNGVDDQNWDVSVKSVAHYPTVVGMMADKIDWTTSLGQAYVNQSTDVATSVQRLRHMARSQGNLQSSSQQEVLEHDNYIAITPYQPEYIYVPVYDPAIIYYRRPYYGPAITFGIGFPIGAWLNLDFRWGYGGGWGGVYYTGWRRGGWGGDCWNCGWINRSRGRVTIVNNVYINNRYNTVNVNRNVIHRTVNVNNLNRYNSVHRNVNYNNVQVNNNRNRFNNANAGRPGNRPGNNGSNGRPNNSPGNQRPGNNSPGNYRPGQSNKMIDRNMDRNNPQIDQHRGRDNNNRYDRPPTAQQPQARQQGRPAAPSQTTRPTPHTFNPSENHFDPRASSQRGQASRQEAPRARPAESRAPQPREQSRPAPRGGERRKP